ncbi:MAG: hypothetical protein ACRD2W_10845 [Acidimicrobiales bacterium]
MAYHADRLEELADELTRRLGIPFQASTSGTIGFRGRMRVTDWAVPLLFDGHAARDDDSIIPTDFVGHLLWPTLRASRAGRTERPWWYCSLKPHVAEALLEELRGYDGDSDEAGAWVVGEDVLLETPTRRVA